ncbi:MAG: serine/threonine-protein kinase [Myxococcota bacterium]|nr:serine/threonine-protein kinase [Myxococcota bacterium]
MKCPRCDRQLCEQDRFCGRCGLARSTDGKPVDPLIGLTIGNRYRIEERIGVGGMGTVYLGTHTRLGQSVAIKVLHERYAGDDKLIQRFEKEALTYGQVCHPNLVSLHDFGRTETGTFYMVLEYCPGVSLAKLVREQGRIQPNLASDLILQIAQGLGQAHQKGIVHRDLKPENVILTEIRPGRYHVRLLDFGIAKHIDDDGPRLTQAGMVFGTPEYMAPEQARGKTVDARSDIYALGTMLYELLVGDPPFTGSDKLRIMHQQAHDAPPKLKNAIPGVSIDKELDGIVMKALEKKPDRRFKDTHALIDALDRYLRGNKATVPAPTVPGQLSADEKAKVSRLHSIVMRVSGHRPKHDHTMTTMKLNLVTLKRPSVLAAIGVAALSLFAVLSFALQDDGDAVQTKQPGVVATSEQTREEPATRGLNDGSTKPKLAGEKRAKRAGDIRFSQTKRMSRDPAGADAHQTPPDTQPGTDDSATLAAKERAARAKREQRRAELEKKKAVKQLNARLSKAKDMLKDGRFEAAAVVVEKLHKAHRRNEAVKRLRNQIIGMRRALQKGQLAYRSGRCAQAVKSMKRVLAVSPKLNQATDIIQNCQYASPPTQL